MKKFIASALMISALSAFANVEVSSYGSRKEFEQFVVHSDKAGVVTVNIDRDIIRVDCHGLPTIYTKDVLSTGEILVNKQYLAFPMNLCAPGTDKTAVTGISFTVAFKQSFGGSEIIWAPVGSKITVKKK